MQTRDKGTVSELYVTQKLIESGYAVSVPTTEERYDLVVDTTDGFVAIQVKRLYEDNGCLVLDCKSSWNGITGDETYSTEEIDGFIGHNPNTDHIYWVEVSEAPTSHMRLRRDPPAGGATHSINWAEDYRFEGFK